MSNQPTVFHITHPKAGSQWIRHVLAGCALKRIIEPKVKVAQFYEDALVPGAIYPTVYVPRPRFEKVLNPTVDLDAQTYRPSPEDEASVQNWYNFVVKQSPVIKFVVIRDLRDTLVSLYFSLKVSHRIISENVAEGRRKLNEMEFEDGFLDMLATRGKNLANIQRSWLPVCQRGEAPLVRYEEFLADEQATFKRIIEYCQIDVSPEKLRKIVERNSFEKRAGRRRGEEDIKSHYRKGIAGDWKNRFTDRIKAEFKQLFGQVLIETGYEKDLDW